MTGAPHQDGKREIRILQVEDAPSDVELTLHALRRADLRFELRVVQEEDPFREALAGFRPDVVLADNRLPRFSGRRALRIAREYDPMLPVIMVTGTLPEERLLRLLRLGLADYALKGSLLRLPAAIIDALDRADARRSAARSRAALEASERRFRAVAEASGDGLMILDGDGNVVFWNAAAERVFGYAAAEVLGTNVARLVPDRHRGRHLRMFRGVLGKGALAFPFTREVSARRADGSEFPAELTVSSWEEDGSRLLSAHVRDITQRKEEARTRNVLSQVVEQTTTSVVITDVDGAIEYVNPSFERLTGYAAHEVLGRNPRVLKSGRHDPEFYGGMWDRIKAGHVFAAEMTNRRKDGTEYEQRTTVFPIVGEGGRIERFVGLGTDVTQERLLESQLRQSQKMEAVGQLAAGVAHDFNNLLTGVLTNAQLLEMTLPEGAAEDERELLADVVAAARRGSDLVKRLMSLSRSSTGTARRVDIRASVDEAVKTVRRLLPENIEVSVEHAPCALTCVLDEGELEQAVFNLANNARDAMPGGGLLAIRTFLADGRPTVEVRDSGMGIEPEVLERIFEPFFTTKEPGKGTGLGLAMIYGFVKRLGGTVTALSRPGAGTTMRLVLVPAPAEASAEEDPPAPAPPVPRDGPRGTVLVAEDQADLRRVAQKVFQRLGYRVLVAADGAEALETLERERGRVDLVFADMVMPRGGGGMLYRHTRDWPDRPLFLFTTGYAAKDLNGDGSLPVPRLLKPWTIADLEAAVSRVVQQGAA